MPERNHGQGKQGGEHRGKGRGFAGMDPQTQRLIASQGGRAAHASGHAHEFTPEEARAAGRKGGEARSQVSRKRLPGRVAGAEPDPQHHHEAIEPMGGIAGGPNVAAMGRLDDGGPRR